MKEIKSRLDDMEPTDEELALDRGNKTQEKYRLVEAIRALLDGRPTNPKLRAILQTEGRVPITKQTVELEADVDRRRFSGGLSDHRDISFLLKDMKPDYGVGKTTTERLKKQGRTIELLTQQLVASRSATAMQVARIDALLLELKKANGRIERLVAGEDEEG